MVSGFVPPKVPAFQRYSAKFVGATLFFWMFYQMRENGAYLIGAKKPWEETHGHDDHHDHHHGDKRDKKH
ncbi:hypothetical protein H4R33_006266 [Dimargaris cristalligena]|uniref:Uncharacterized protein n=1 Tax=Dimargaris cristalligena TaxID=215637 RepID=A0A4Q0A1A1_9FUNG|nr:hypothetical protein H4R33_006266 [Dimargaris cristalligena]RKP39886.1 hypothetical protein BJ085DRAFT_36767 [Dimargaris cristalligena]|eukprot:RKP39886.1 hypothetical protein BJ085DRAFT_36767 [Dimargaris cristalligena]